MEELTGRWLMNKALSTGIDAMLKLQGISWILRKGVSLATVHLEISIYPDPESSSTPPASVIDILGIPTGGLPSTREIRITDWKEKEQQEFLFGKCIHKTQVVRAAKGKTGEEGEEGEKRAKGYPGFEMQTEISEEKVRRFLRGEVLEDGSETEWAAATATGTSAEDMEGEAGDAWVHSFVKNVDEGVGWTSEQVWGFEVINGERFHTRRVLVATPRGEYALGRVVYKLAPKGAESDGK